MPDFTIGRLVRKFSVLLVLVAALFFVASSDVGTTEAFAACTLSCRQECVQAYNYCRTHPDEYYEGCNFVRECATTPSATRCDNEECCYQYRYWCGYDRSPQTGYCWSLNCL